MKIIEKKYPEILPEKLQTVFVPYVEFVVACRKFADG